MINHTRTTGPVVFLHCSGATKVVKTITLRIEHIVGVDDPFSHMGTCNLDRVV